MIGGMPSSPKDLFMIKFHRVLRSCLVLKIVSSIVWGTAVTVSMDWSIVTSRVDANSLAKNSFYLSILIQSRFQKLTVQGKIRLLAYAFGKGSKWFAAIKHSYFISHASVEGDFLILRTSCLLFLGEPRLLMLRFAFFRRLWDISFYSNLNDLGYLRTYHWLVGGRETDGVSKKGNKELMKAISVGRNIMPNGAVRRNFRKNTLGGLRVGNEAMIWTP